MNNSHQIFIHDRGFFDSLAFLKLLEIDNLESNNNFIEKSHFLLNCTWTKHIDYIFILSGDENVILERDLAQKLNSGFGIITRQNTLVDLLGCYNFLVEKYKNYFNKIFFIDTTKLTILDTVKFILETIKLEILKIIF